MYNDSAAIMVFNTLTSTHAGSGTELSHIDMPIQREGHTGYPKIEASTLKGCIRAVISEKRPEEKEVVEQLFGNADHGDYASAISLTDARLLFFPVKSARGVLGWVTCPMVLERFFKEYRLTFGRGFAKVIETGQSNLVADTCVLDQQMGKERVIMLEEYTYNVKRSSEAAAFFEELVKILPENAITRDMLATHAVILSNDDFAGFVKYSTEVNTRIKIDSTTGTVTGSALFTEEYLPPECILYSLSFFTDTHQPQEAETNEGKKNKSEVRDIFTGWLDASTIQVGANSTLGKGLVQVKVWEDR